MPLAYREVFWNITYGELIYLFALVAVGVWGYSLYKRFKMWQMGKPEDRTKDLGRRAVAFVRTGITDVNGVYIIKGLPTGNYTITAVIVVNGNAMHAVIRRIATRIAPDG